MTEIAIEATEAMAVNERTSATRRQRLRGTSLGLAVLAAGLVWASPAHGIYGDEYGAAPINGHPQAIQDAPAIPSDAAFWAGACDRSAAPAFDVPLAPIGDQTGFGARPSTVLAGTGETPRLAPSIPGQIPVPAPQAPDHCLDWGAHTMYLFRSDQQGQIWQSFPYDLGLPHPSGSGVIGQTLPGCTLADGPPFPDACDFAPKWRLPAATGAGGHPDGSTMLVWNRNKEGVGAAIGSVEGSVDNVYVDLPPGFVGNPQAVPQCTNLEFREQPPACPPQSQVGVIRLNLQGDPVGVGINMGDTLDNTLPVFNLEPRKGKVAELGIVYAGSVAAVRLVADARTNGDFGVTAFTGQIPAALIPVAQQITLWGVPWAPENDEWRAKVGHYTGPSECRAGATTAAAEFLPPGGLPSSSCRAVYDPSWGEVKPFLTNETDCSPAPTVRLATDSFQHQGAFTSEGDPALPPAPQLLTGAAAEQSGWKTYDSPSPATVACEDLDFEPELDLTPTASVADGATGLRARVDLPQNNRPRDGDGNPLDPQGPGYLAAAADYWNSGAGRATAHLKDTVVTLPPGVSLNPSAATGLEACSDTGIGLRAGTDAYSGRRLFNNGDPFDGDSGDGAECPDGSKIGTARVDTPLLADPLVGDVVLGEPKSTDPQSGEMFRLFIVVRDPERGLVAKIYGTSTADGVVGEGGSGQLVTTFESNPEVPFDSIELEIKGGDKGLLALPTTCGSPGWTSTFTPWSSVGAATPVADVDRTGSFAVSSRCTPSFGPALSAGSANPDARAQGVFSLRLTRPEGDQTIQGVTVRMPRGLLASLRGVPLCDNASGDAGSCPAGSLIGTVDGSAGSGTPFVLERKGSVYLTRGYKGGSYGLSIVVPVEAGPFKGDKALRTIVVRAAIHVDRSTAEVTVVSDPLPQVWHGIPLRVREIVATIDRPDFMLNPSDCTAQRVEAGLTSSQGWNGSPSSPFEVTNCPRLSFRPRLALRLTGRRQVRTGKHPGVNAVVRQGGISEAGIDRARVTLPRSLALDPANAQALCEFEDGTKPDLEQHCPRGSVIGRARAVTPLLNDPLVGNVYFVKNVERNLRIGALIRKLPMLIVALRGEIAINLTGKSSTSKDGRLINTFAAVPDAPISQFNMSIAGGSNGILAVTRTSRARINLCTKPKSHIARARMNGQNGKRRVFGVRMKTPCAKRKSERGNAKRDGARRGKPRKR